MVAFNTIKPEDRLYSVTRGKMGNTTLSTTRVHDVKVIEVDAQKRRALVSWNGNPAKWQGEYYISKLRRSPPKATR